MTNKELTNVRLDDLIDGIRAVHDDPLEQLSSAVIAAQHLGDVADALVGHFVDQARRAGASWTTIGTSMGVSKQAAQKRFVRPAPAPDDAANPFARFTPRSRNAVVTAHNLAAGEGADHVGTPHLARGVIAETASLAVAVLTDLGMDPAGLSARLTPADHGAADPAPMIPYDDAAKAALEGSVTEALNLGHNYVGTEHLMLALYDDATVGGLLVGAGHSKEEFAAAIAAALDQLKK